MSDVVTMIVEMIEGSPRLVGEPTDEHRQKMAMIDAADFHTLPGVGYRNTWEHTITYILNPDFKHRYGLWPAYWMFTD